MIPVVVPFVVAEPLPVVQVTIAGKRANFAIDTGAPDIVVDQDLARQLRLHVRSAGMGIFAGGMHAPVRRTIVPSFAIGSASVSNFSAAVMPGLAFPGIRVQGIVGTGFFSHFITTIDYAHHVLRLYPKSDSVAFERQAQARHLDSEPMRVVANHYIFASGHVNDGPAGQYNIDTGGAGFGVQLTKASVDAAHVRLDTNRIQRGMGGGGPVSATPFTADVTLAHTTVRNVPGIYFAHGDQYKIFHFTVAGTITDAYFRHSSVTFDFAAMRIVLGA